MIEEIRRWSEKLQEGLELAHNFHFEHQEALPKNITKIAIVGMGGSGVVGSIVQTLFEKRSNVPVFVIRSSEVPTYIDTSTLAIVVSYSGNTWETVQACHELVRRHVPCIVLTRGGKLGEIVMGHNLYSILVPESLTPRSALGNFLGIVLTLFDCMGLIDGANILEHFQKYLSTHQPKISEEVHYKGLFEYLGSASFFHVWGVSGDSFACAYRAQTQFNENSKVQAVASEFPELNHNLVVGFTKDIGHVIWYATSVIPPHLEIAEEALCEVLARRGVPLTHPVRW